MLSGELSSVFLQVHPKAMASHHLPQRHPGESTSLGLAQFSPPPALLTVCSLHGGQGDVGEPPPCPRHIPNPTWFGLSRSSSCPLTPVLTASSHPALLPVPRTWASGWLVFSGLWSPLLHLLREA